MEITDEEKQLIISRRALFPQPHPWILIIHGKHRQLQTFISISKNGYCRRKFHELQNKFICASSYGWLVLKDDSSEEHSLLNLVSMEKIELPRVDFDYDNCILTSNPDCYVAFIDSSDLSIYSWKPGDIEFDESKLHIGDCHLHCATAFDGKIYGVATNNYPPVYHLVFLEFRNSGLNFEPLISGTIPVDLLSDDIIFSDIYLIESCGELLLVFKMFTGLQQEVFGFLVFEADFSLKTWVKKDDIGERTIFLCPYRLLSFVGAESGVGKNSIYYMNQEDQHLYIFDLQNKTISESFPCLHCKAFWRSWIMLPVEFSEKLSETMQFM